TVFALRTYLHLHLHSFPTRRSSDLSSPCARTIESARAGDGERGQAAARGRRGGAGHDGDGVRNACRGPTDGGGRRGVHALRPRRSEERRVGKERRPRREWWCEEKNR